jgi:UrcA family protein
MNLARSFAACGATLIAASAIFAVPPAQAGPLQNVAVVGRASQPFTRQVSYADLNLASKSDVKVLTNRVDYAVRDVCSALLSESFQDTMQECAGDSWDRAQPQIGRAVQRAREIASTGSSSIAAAAIMIGPAD